jgi:dipeptidase
MIRVLAVTAGLMATIAIRPASGCTNFLITKGASADGSTMITYAADAHDFYGELYYKPAASYSEGAMVDVYEWDTGTRLGQIPQVRQTYSVVGNMNEHQVAIGETTFGGREELVDPEGIVDYGSLMYLALQRSKTAREAISVMTSLVAEFGYPSEGESFSVADPNEAWILEMVGKGPGNTGAVWVARKIPDGFISGHANAARIRRFPLDQPDTTLYAPDVISFARDQGYFEGPDESFSFADAYAPDDFGARRFCDARVWCMYRRAAPSQDLPADWVEGEADAEPIPLWIRPDHKLSVADVMGLMRDHFEGTELDMTADIGAGPHSLPYRWRPLTWEVDGVEYFNERAVSTQQTGFSFVAQARSWLPDPVGGVLWFGVDDTASTVYFPASCGATEVPPSYAEGTGSFHDVTFDAAFWVFNQVANFAYLRYDDMIRDIQVVQADLEGRFLAAQPEIDAAALALYEQSPRLARDYLTRYTVDSGEAVVARWRELSKELLYTYMDGNVKDEHGNVTHPPYPEAWYRMVAEATGENLKMRTMPAEKLAADHEAAEIRATAAAVVTLLEARGLAFSDSQRETITTSDDLEQLHGWLVRAATADAAAEVLGDD